MRRLAFICAAISALAADAAQAEPTVTAEQAVERQQEQVRRMVERKCSAPTAIDEIVVCGERQDEEAYALRTAYRGTDYGRQRQASLFEVKLGPATIGCCAVDGAKGTGAGLSLRIPF